MNKVVFDQTQPKIDYAKQLAALPWRVTDEGQVEVLLVTSRVSQHWLLPKGWPMTGKTLPQAAAQEALEEAGVSGKLQRKPCGKYRYQKVLKDGITTVPCTVVCFGLKVTRELPQWQEAHQRTRRWFPLSEASKLVFEPDLARMLASERLAKHLTPDGKAR